MYWVIFPAMYDDGAVLSAVPDTGPDAYKYDEGIPLLRRFPEQNEAVMCFDPDYDDRIKLYDIVPALDSILIVNSKVKQVLAAMEIKDMEYLPIRLWNHRREPVSDDYCILNPLGGVDIIDMEHSEYTMNPLNEGQIADIDNLVVNHKSIPPDAKVFRAKTKMDQLFIDDDVRIAFEQTGIQGYKIFPAEGWDGLDI